MSGKFAYNGTNQFDYSSKVKSIYIGEVVEVDDSKELGRIKVRIKGIDDAITKVDDLPWAFPMIPKFFGVHPKNGEAVLIFRWDNEKTYEDRLYIGPIISQPQNLEYDPLYFSALAGFTFGNKQPKVAPNTIPDLKGVFPNKEDISIQGRINTDVILKDNEIVIRSGKFKVKSNQTNSNAADEFETNIEFNKVDPAYIQIKYDAILKPATDKMGEVKGSVTNIVASKINLLTHKDGSPRFNLTDQEFQITEEELFKILEEAHPVVFGDYLLQYLKLLKNAILNHVHNGNGNPATDLTGAGQQMTVDALKKHAEELEVKMLSKNIRVN